MLNKITLLTLMAFGPVLINAQTKIIAHRGYSGIAPENTLIAFQKAIEIGADYIELDIHKTKDDSIVVIHDATVDRTSSNRMSGKVSEMTYGDLAAIRVGHPAKFGGKFKNEKISTLREVLELAKGKIKVCIEIKVYGAEEGVLKIVEDQDVNDEVIIFSFYYPVLAKIRRLDKKIPTLFLANSADSLTLDYANVIDANAVGVGPGTAITKTYLDRAHTAGLEVWKWTVDEEEEMEQLIATGVDGLITNLPDKAIKRILQ